MKQLSHISNHSVGLLIKLSVVLALVTVFVVPLSALATGVTHGPYTFDADNDADESAWTFVSDNGTDGLLSNSGRSWSHDTNDTPSTNIGPTSGQGGSPDGYVYTEATGASSGDTFHMTHNTVLDAAAKDWTLDFYWNQRGNDNLATVTVQTNENGGGWVTRQTYATGGPDVASAGTQVWNQETLDLSALIGDSSTQLRLFVTLGSTGSIWNNDFGLDTITLTGASLGPTVTASTTTAIGTSTATFNGAINALNGATPATRGFEYSTDPTFATGVATTSEFGGSYDISTASYDSIVLDVSTQEGNIRSLLFNNDGTRLYVMGWQGDDINQYTLSTPYDISTASFDSVVLLVQTQETHPTDMLFNNDGTVLYVVGSNGDDINEYTLSTPYDINTASFDSIALDSAETQESSPGSMIFNNDGTVLYVLGNSDGDIKEYTLSTPYDISTASFDSIVLDVSTQETGPNSMLFNHDGTGLYVLGQSGEDINEYTLSTPYDISTASFDSIALSVSGQEIYPTAMLFNHDSTRLYVAGYDGDDINEYTLGTPFTTGAFALDVTGLDPFATYYVRAFTENVAGIGYSTSTDSFTTSLALPTVTISTTTAIETNTATFNGEVIATGGGSLSARGFEYSTDPTFATGVATTSEFSGSYDISTASFDSVVLDISTQEGLARSLRFNNDGTRLYLMGWSGDDINEYTLSTPYDINTALFDSIALSVSTRESNPASMLFNSDGTVLYVMGQDGDDINEYTLSTPYDISTASFDSIVLDVSGQEEFPASMIFNHDGTGLYVMGSDGDDINEYTLSTPYDISTASFDSIALDVSGHPTSMIFNNDGTGLYVLELSRNINEYTLSTPYDISTASFDSIALSVSAQETYPRFLFFNNDGTVLYVMGDDSDINAYTLGTPLTTGTFARNVTGLDPSTTYYVRAFAENDAGIGYSTSTDSFSYDNNTAGSSTISNHSDSQVNNAFSFQNQTNETLFAFNLNPTSGVATTTDITFTLSGVDDIVGTDFTNLKLFVDTNSDAAYDGGDTQVGGAGVMALSGQWGTITFSTEFGMTAAEDYILVSDWDAPERGSSFTISLPTSGVVSTDGGTQDIFGSVDTIQHSRKNSGGGGSSVSVGVVAPAGDGGLGGGTNKGGDSIGSNPNYKVPTANSGSWTNPSSAYDGTDGTYTTDSSGATNNYSNHGFSVPESNTIDGIAVQLEVSGTTAAGSIGIELSWDGGTSWTDSGNTSGTLTATDAVVTIGGPSDTWGRTWTDTEFSNANFAVRLTGNPSSNTVQVDAIQVRIHHQVGGGDSGAGGAGGAI
jgi:6-phosphogluconolactonase (cycloisomerase 2 family)